MNIFEGYKKENVKFAYKTISPALIVILLLLGVPVFYAIWQSFFNVTVFSPEWDFVGIANYLNAFTDPIFQASLLRSGVFAFSTISLSILMGLSGALLLNRDIPGRGILRGLSLLPFLISGVAVGVIWQWLFASEIGVLNNMLALVGLPPISWLSDPVWAMISIVIANVWRFFPFPLIILLAGLQQIDQSYYEAAEIDGASGWQSFRHITLPMIKPMMKISLIYVSFAAFNQFATIFSMTGGGPGHSTEVLALNMYKTAFQNFNWGYGSTLAIILLIINIILSGSYNKYFETEE